MKIGSSNISDRKISRRLQHKVCTLSCIIFIPNLMNYCTDKFVTCDSLYNKICMNLREILDSVFQQQVLNLYSPLRNIFTAHNAYKHAADNTAASVQPNSATSQSLHSCQEFLELFCVHMITKEQETICFLARSILRCWPSCFLKDFSELARISCGSF